MNNIIANGKQYEIKNFSISGDIDSFSFSWSAELENYADYLALNPSSEFIECSYNLVLTGYNGENYNYDLGNFALLIESATRSNSTSRQDFKISGRGKNALLDSRYNEKLDYSFKNVSAQTTVTNICASSNISLHWNIVDWIIPSYEATAIYPLDAIRAIVDAIGAAIQPTISGGLAVIYRNKQKPTDALIPDYYFNEDDILSISESYEDRAGYDWVTIGNEDDATNDITASISYDAEKRLVDVSICPFQDINIFHSMQNENLQLHYQGIKTKSIAAEIVTVIDGKANLSNNCYSVVSMTWIDNDLGAVTVLESGDVTTEIIGNGLFSVDYQTKYHQYLASPFNNIKNALVWVEAKNE